MIARQEVPATSLDTRSTGSVQVDSRCLTIRGPVNVDKRPCQPEPLLERNVERRLPWSDVQQRSGRHAVVIIDPPANGNGASVLKFDIRVLHPLVNRFRRHSPPCGRGLWHRSFTGRLLLLACLIATPSARSLGQATSPPAQPARALWRSLIGDLLVEFRRSGTPGTLSIALADSARAATMAVRATDARRFADSLLVLSGRRALPRMAFRLSLEEPGLGSGALRVVRREVPKGEKPARPYTLFASDEPLTGVSAPITVAELKLFATRLRAAARAVSPPTPTRKRGK